jgi:hypothetical protein
MARKAESVELDLATPKPWRRFVPLWLRSLIWADSAAHYDAFLSYSWQADSKTASLIHSVLQRFLCPWYKRRAKTVFRDLSCMPAGSSLKRELFDRMNRSTHLIVLASPEAAYSEGMEMEASHWFKDERHGEILIIVTAGEFKTWVQIRDNLLPATVRDELASEPLWIPLQHRRHEILADPNSQKLRGQLIEDLRQVFLRLYAPQTWEELQGEERTQRRRALGMTAAAALLFLGLAVAAVRFGVDAQKQSKLAQQRQQQAESARDAEINARLAETQARKDADASAKEANDQKVIAEENAARAQRNARESNARALAAYSTESLSEDPEKSVLLGMEAVNATLRFGQLPLPAAEGALHQAILSSQVRMTLRGHSGDVGSVAFSPDGKRLASGLYQTAKVWDAESGKELLTLGGHSDTVNSVAFGPDGKRLATASGLDQTAKVWDAESGKELLTLRGHLSRVNSVAFRPDGKRLATASVDQTAKVWDAESGKELLTLRGHSSAVYSVAFSPDGKRLASASSDRTVQVYALDVRELLNLARSRITRILTANECERYFQSKTCPPLP